MKYAVRGTVNINYMVEVEADTEEEAMEMVDDMDLTIDYYSNDTIGINKATIIGDDDNFESYEAEEL